MKLKDLWIVGLVLAATVGQAQAAFVRFGSVDGNENYVHRISGLEIAGTFYDVTFNEGSFDSVYNATGLTGEFEPTPFTTSEEAGVATTAVVDFLNANYDAMSVHGFTGDVTAETDYLSYFFIPYWQELSDEPVSTHTGSTNEAGTVATDEYPYEFARNESGGDFEYHWATFAASSATVPEPASFVMWGLGSLILVGRRLRRKLA